MAWTDKMIEDLKKMWKEGLTTGEIGKRLNVSKNSIVGKVHRLGLSGRPSPIKKKEAKPQSAAGSKAKTPAPKAKPQKPVAAPQKAPVSATPKAPLKTEPAKAEKKTPLKTPAEPKQPAPAKGKTIASSAQNLSLTELDNHTCRWPLGDPKDDNFHFCGKKVRVGQTYCDEHAAVAYVKPGKK